MGNLMRPYKFLKAFPLEVIFTRALPSIQCFADVGARTTAAPGQLGSAPALPPGRLYLPNAWNAFAFLIDLSGAGLRGRVSGG